MNTIQKIFAMSVLAVSITLPASSFAQAATEHNGMNMSQPASMTEGK